MVYSQKEDDTSSWYVSFDRKTEWRVNKTKCILADIITGYMEDVEPATEEHSTEAAETLR